MKARGQVETIGLLVIVLLLIVIGLIVLRFSLHAPSSSLPDTRSSLESTKLLQALVLTKIQGDSFADHSQRCSTDRTACLLFQQELERIFSLLLRKGQQYNFSLSLSDQNLFTLGRCSTGVMSSYPFTAGGGFYEASLRLCSGGS